MLISPRLFPLTAAVSARLLRHHADEARLKREEIAPAETLWDPPPMIEPGELDLVTQCQEETSFENERLRMQGGERRHGATLRYHIRDALVSSNGVYTATASYLRYGRLPLSQTLGATLAEVEQGFFAANQVTLRYFGHFCNDALPCAALARENEELFLPYDPAWGHARGYLGLLGLRAPPSPLARVRDLYFADDRGLNSHRRRRTRAIQDRIHNTFGVTRHPDVYLRRGNSGVRRTLANDDALSERLAAEGFAICDINTPLPELLATLSQARTVVTMEGSHWVHAHLAAARGALIVKIIPADRFNLIAADMVGALEQRFAAIVAPATENGYLVDINRLLRRIDSARDAIAS